MKYGRTGMSELVRVAVDAMGGDDAPFVTVKGAVDENPSALMKMEVPHRLSFL